MRVTWILIAVAGLVAGYATPAPGCAAGCRRAAFAARPERRVSVGPTCCDAGAAPPLDEPPLPTAPPSDEAPATPSQPHRAGFVSIIGMPNVGKSTLMNKLIGERLSIMTAKAGTTRHRILGILNGDDYQLIYSDTPGIYSTPQYKLQEGMMAAVKGSLNDADLVLLVVDVFQETWEDEAILRQVESQACPLIVLVNKVDLVREGTPLPPATLARLGTEDELLARWRSRFPEASVLPVSADNGEGLDGLLSRVRACLPFHEPFFPKDQLTDRPERFFAGEMVREAIFEGYRQVQMRHLYTLLHHQYLGGLNRE